MATTGATGLDIASLDTVVQELFASGLAGSTQKVYHTGSRRFSSFCEWTGISKPFPVSEGTLMRFATYLYRDGLKAGTIKSYLAAVRHTQITLGLGDPKMHSMPQLEYVVRGIKKMVDNSVRPRLPRSHLSY